ncbi:MAG: MBOAT family protein [Verrucomicrobia bacterium]|nr:MBOAT family protein [Verrucomicrobiota bacterium]
MNFAELRFWGWLALGLICVVTARGILGRVAAGRMPVFDKVALFSLGLFLLLCVSWVTFIIFLCVAVGTYLGLGWILRYHAAHATEYLLVLIPLQLLPLAYYKYSDFLVNQVLGLQAVGLEHLIIPVGISFYTFQKVAFVIDTLAFHEPLPALLDYLNFAGFFPQIVAGPIERRRDLLPQMERFRFRWDPEAIDEGAGWVALGLFFKCALADNLATYFDASSVTNPYLIWLANGVFGLRIYYDFAGYSLIAVGLGRALGIRLTLNFLSPYCATSATEFWRRWHVTLSQWFRDYVYIPMGGGRTPVWAWNVAVVFVASGIWHGAGWNFVLWGALHALFLITNRRCKNWIPAAFPSWLLTMVASFYAWLCFYERRTGVLLAKLRVLLTPHAYQLDALRAATHHWAPGDAMVLAGFMALAASVLLLEWVSVRRENQPYYYLRRRPVLVGLVILTVLLAPETHNSFIYFAF